MEEEMVKKLILFFTLNAIIFLVSVKLGVAMQMSDDEEEHGISDISFSAAVIPSKAFKDAYAAQKGSKVYYNADRDLYYVKSPGLYVDSLLNKNPKTLDENNDGALGQQNPFKEGNGTIVFLENLLKDIHNFRSTLNQVVLINPSHDKVPGLKSADNLFTISLQASGDLLNKPDIENFNVSQWLSEKLKTIISVNDDLYDILHGYYATKVEMKVLYETEPISCNGAKICNRVSGWLGGECGNNIICTEKKTYKGEKEVKGHACLCNEMSQLCHILDTLMNVYKDLKGTNQLYTDNFSRLNIALGEISNKLDNYIQNVKATKMRKKKKKRDAFAEYEKKLHEMSLTLEDKNKKLEASRAVLALCTQNLFTTSGSISTDIAGQLGRHVSLQLSSLGITDEMTKEIALIPNLTFLDVSHNRIGITGAKILAEVKTLTSLNLSHNHIENEGAQAFAIALEVNTALIFLKLDNNGVKKSLRSKINKLINKNKACSTEGRKLAK